MRSGRPARSGWSGAAAGGLLLAELAVELAEAGVRRRTPPGTGRAARAGQATAIVAANRRLVHQRKLMVLVAYGVSCRARACLALRRHQTAIRPGRLGSPVFPRLHGKFGGADNTRPPGQRVHTRAAGAERGSMDRCGARGRSPWPRAPAAFTWSPARCWTRCRSSAELQVGLLHLLIAHTSASLALNENASPDVRRDFESWANRGRPGGGTVLDAHAGGPG